MVSVNYAKMPSKDVKNVNIKIVIRQSFVQNVQIIIFLMQKEYVKSEINA